MTLRTLNETIYSMAEPPGASQHRAPRYLGRFQCTGPACEDTCCAGWGVHVDQAHHERLQRAMAGSIADRDAFETAVELDASGLTDPERFAALRMRPSGECMFLDGDRLCSVQKRFGPSMLGNMCAMYPRDVAQIGERFEATATLSCPEAARLCLLAPDAMHIEELNARSLPRAHVYRALYLDADDPYLAHFDLIRDTAQALLSLDRYELATRLFFLAFLAQRVTPFFHQQAREVDERQLVDTIARLRQSAMLDELAREWQRINVPPAWALRVIQVILMARLHVHIPAFHQLVIDVLSTYRGAETEPSSGTISADPDQLCRGYENRRDHWIGRCGPQIDQILTNYCKNYWLKDWYVASPNLLVHAQKLFVRLCIVRFLLFSHPRLVAAQLLGGQDDADNHALETTAVEVFYKFCRALEHDTSFLDKIQEALRGEGMDSFSHLVLLLKF